MNYNILVDNTNTSFNNHNISNNSNNNVNNIHIANSGNQLLNSANNANCATMNVSNSIVDLAALSTINADLKTADIRPDNEFGNLFRGLSSVIDIDGIALDSFTSIIERQASKRDGGKGALPEPTIDLSDLILQGQSMHQSGQPQPNVPIMLMPAAAMSNENHIGQPVARRAPERPPAPTKMVTRSSIVEAKKQHQQNSENVQVLTSQESKTTRRTSSRVNVKRLSTGSNASSSTSGLTETKTERRGRKPASMAGNGESQTKTEKMKLIAKQQLQVPEDKLARFGNKFVIKDTNEYDERRKKNNDAVKKCREKNAEIQKEREEKMSRLHDENRRLQSTVDTLMKELNVLKGIIRQTTHPSQLPQRIQSILKEEKE